MKILVTGATGYIGDRLTRQLLQLGHEVHALARTKPTNEDTTNLIWHEGDLSDAESLRAAMHGCEQVFHLAAFARPWAKDATTYNRVNVLGTANLLQVAWQQGVQKFIHSSSCATYGCSFDSPIDETHVRSIDFFTDYERSKFLAEEKVMEYAKLGLDAVIVSPSKVYGPGIWTESNAVSQLIRSYIQGDWHIIPGDGKARGCFCFIDDVVDGYLKAASHGVAGEKYILGGENASFNEFFSKVSKLSGKHYLLLRIPTPLMLLYGWKEELMAHWFNVPPLITRPWIKKYNYHLECSSKKAEDELGYRITPLDEGITRTLEWLEEEQTVYY